MVVNADIGPHFFHKKSTACG